MCSMAACVVTKYNYYLMNYRESMLMNGSCFHTEKESQPWFAVDLKSPYAIRAVDIYNRGDNVGEYTNLLIPLSAQCQL